MGGAVAVDGIPTFAAVGAVAAEAGAAITAGPAAAGATKQTGDLALMLAIVIS